MLWRPILIVLCTTLAATVAADELEHQSPGFSEQMNQAQRALAMGLAERARKLAEEVDEPLTTGSISRPGLLPDKRLLDPQPFGVPETLTRPEVQSSDVGTRRAEQELEDAAR